MYLLCQIKKSSKKIREARQGRVTQPSLEGEKVTIVLCHSNGKEKRQFNKGAFFQVYIYIYIMIQFVALKSTSSKMQTYSDCLIIFFFNVNFFPVLMT